MKILAFGASSKTPLIKLATYAASLFENGEVEILDLNEYQMPLFSVDIEEEIGNILAKAIGQNR
jgi:hypothetical protein